MSLYMFVCYIEKVVFHFGYADEGVVNENHYGLVQSVGVLYVLQRKQHQL